MNAYICIVLTLCRAGCLTIYSPPLNRHWIGTLGQYTCLQANFQAESEFRCFGSAKVDLQGAGAPHHREPLDPQQQNRKNLILGLL